MVAHHTRTMRPSSSSQMNFCEGLHWREPISFWERSCRTIMSLSLLPKWVSARLPSSTIYVLVGLLGVGYAQNQVVQRVTEAKHGKSKPLYALIQNRPFAATDNQVPEIENRVRLLPVPTKAKGAHATALALNTEAGIGSLDALTSRYFSGVGWDRNYRVKVSPPDTNGAVGTNDYVQWVNQAYGIFDKTTRNLKVVVDPGSGEKLQTIWNGSLIWQGFGGKCEFSNDGDPIVIFDKLANPPRWVMSQFAHTKPSGAPYSQCIAVSTTSDPAGEYALYEFQFNNFNDYGKFGVWLDGYYGVFNMFEDDTKNSDYLGTKVCSFDRSKMLQGTTASIQCVNLYQPQYSGILPADFDGTASSTPVDGSPELFVGLDSNKLNLWTFKVNWNDMTKSTFDRVPVEIPVASFDYPCVKEGYEYACISQPGSDTQRLEVLGDRLMYRLTYRNRGTRESLVLNHTVMVGTRTGIRWYEIDSPFNKPTVRQQGTFAPKDALFRWMGSIAVDKKGNMLLEYSVSGDKVYPSLRYTGRRNDDPVGQMRSERELVVGSGSQINQDERWATDRWGDYSSVVLDPVDDCTFWLTNQYQSKTGTYNWNTAIASVRFPNCQ
jgi:hypothetical protein